MSSRHVVITGAARGIGRAIAETLIAQGATVALGDIDLEVLESTSIELGVTAYAKLDVCDLESFRAFMDHAKESLGSIDVLINNAGIMPVGLLSDMDYEVARRAIEINLIGTITGTKLALETMLPQGHGHIVNVASSVGESAMPGIAAYCASKFGIVGFASAMQAEVRKSGVKLTTVLPGFIDTELTAGAHAPPGFAAVGPDAVAKAISRVLDHPRQKLYVPSSVGRLLTFQRFMPASLSRALSQRLGSDRIFVQGVDKEARRGYESRVRHS